jgi:hypothetical protein
MKFNQTNCSPVFSISEVPILARMFFLKITRDDKTQRPLAAGKQ